MRLRYSRRAVRQISQIADYLRERSPAAARRVGDRLDTVIQLILERPHIGRAGAAVDTREFPVPGLPYIIAYRIRDRTGVDPELWIAGIYHVKQLRPGQSASNDG